MYKIGKTTDSTNNVVTEKFKNRYRWGTARASWWNYGQNGIYFITICTASHCHYFGHISNDQMKFTPVGQHARKCWQAIPGHFPFVILDEFVVMPNHIHGIIEIDKPIPSVGPQNLAASYDNKFGPQSCNLGSIIRGFKVGVKKYTTQNNIHFTWQSRYYNHIIRNEKSHQNIQHYIETYNITSKQMYKIDKTTDSTNNVGRQDFAVL